MKGNFVIRKSERYFSAISTDQAHEQNNAIIKGDGGAIGILNDASTLDRWTTSGPEVARILAEFDVCNTNTSKPNTNHHQQTKSEQNRFYKNVHNLVNSIEEYGNPFLDVSEDLVVLDTRDIADKSVVNTVKSIEKVGTESYSNYVNERIISHTRQFNEPIKRNKLPLLSTIFNKKPTKSDIKLSGLKNDVSLFSRLFIACQVRELSLENFFYIRKSTVSSIFISKWKNSINYKVQSCRYSRKSPSW